MCGFPVTSVGRANLINGCPEDGSSVQILVPVGCNPGISAKAAAMFSWKGAGARLRGQQPRPGRTAVRAVGHQGLAFSSGETTSSACRSQLRNHAGLAFPGLRPREAAGGRGDAGFQRLGRMVTGREGCRLPASESRRPECKRGSDPGAYHRARRVRFDAEGADVPQKSLTIPGHMTIYGYWLALHLTSGKLPGSPLCNKWPQSPKLRWISLWTDSCA